MQNQGVILQHDNARPHTARITTQFLAQNGVNVLEWPAVSPDQNPIEHMWDELGRRVRNNHEAGKSAAVDVGKKLVAKALTPKSKKKFRKIYGTRDTGH